MKFLKLISIFCGIFLLPAAIFAQEADSPLAKISSDTAALTVAADTLWVLLAGILVFFMQAGFALVEAGLNAAKNSVNILYKNLMDFAVGSLAFFFVGFALMFGTGNDFIGLSGWMMSGADNSPAMNDAYQGVYASLSWSGVPLLAKFFFQMVFAATAATIVSGSVAGRIKFNVYLLYSLIISAVIYPISGHWIWGGGWLSTFQGGFHDFAGSIVVHAVGGFAGLAGAIVLGPRVGKFSPDKKPQVMAGHNLPLAALGVFILWMGWYGFNPGSTMAIVGDSSTLVNVIATNTTLAASAGAITAMIVMWLVYGKPELTMTLNGTLAGLVAITAPCDIVTPVESIVIGAVGGILVILGVKILDILGIDDPVGAWPVHGLNGVWGGIAVGIFGEGSHMLAQIVGSLVVPLYSFAAMLVVFKILDVAMKIRVTRDEELKGLDIGEHGEEAYKGFAIFTLD